MSQDSLTTLDLEKLDHAFKEIDKIVCDTDEVISEMDSSSEGITSSRDGNITEFSCDIVEDDNANGLRTSPTAVDKRANVDDPLEFESNKDIIQEEGDTATQQEDQFSSHGNSFSEILRNSESSRPNKEISDLLSDVGQGRSNSDLSDTHFKENTTSLGTPIAHQSPLQVSSLNSTDNHEIDHNNISTNEEDSIKEGNNVLSNSSTPADSIILKEMATSRLPESFEGETPSKDSKPTNREDIKRSKDSHAINLETSSLDVQNDHETTLKSVNSEYSLHTKQLSPVHSNASMKSGEYQDVSERFSSSAQVDYELYSSKANTEGGSSSSTGDYVKPLNMSQPPSVSSRWWKDVEYALSQHTTNTTYSKHKLMNKKSFLTLETPLDRRKRKHFPFSSMKVTKTLSFQTTNPKPSFRSGASKYTINKKIDKLEPIANSVIMNDHTDTSLSPGKSAQWIDDADQLAFLSPGREGIFPTSAYAMCNYCGRWTKLLLVCFVAVLLTVGCYVFYETEYEKYKERKEKIQNIENNMKEILTRYNLPKNVSKEFENQLQAFTTTLLGVEENNFTWSYSDALLISFSLISSTGIQVPLSFNGRLFAIFYTVTGLPISIMFIWIYSRLPAKLLKYVYDKIWPEKVKGGTSKRYSVGDSGYVEIRHVPLKVSIPIFLLIFALLALFYKLMTDFEVLASFYGTVQLLSFNGISEFYSSRTKTLGTVIAFIFYSYSGLILFVSFLRLAAKPWRHLVTKLDFFAGDIGSKVKSRVLRGRTTPVNRMNSSQLSKKINELTLPTSFVNSRVMTLDEHGKTIGIMSNIDRDSTLGS